MRADTRAISIDADPAKVHDFLADPRNLPRWAVGFARSVRPDGDSWLVETSAGPMPVRIVAEPRTGTVDFVMTPAPGTEARAASRVIGRPGGAEYVFTQFQGPGMTDDLFTANVRAIEHELIVLKALMEVECPL